MVQFSGSSKVTEWSTIGQLGGTRWNSVKYWPGGTWSVTFQNLVDQIDWKVHHSVRFHQIPPSSHFLEIPPNSTIQWIPPKFVYWKFHQIPPNFTKFPPSVEFHQIPPFSRFHQIPPFSGIPPDWNSVDSTKICRFQKFHWKLEFGHLRLEDWWKFHQIPPLVEFHRLELVIPPKFVDFTKWNKVDWKVDLWSP